MAVNVCCNSNRDSFPTISRDPDDAAESSLSSSKRNYRSRRSASASPEPNKASTIMKFCLVLLQIAKNV